jgi:uncharacterized protein DUF4333
MQTLLSSSKSSTRAAFACLAVAAGLAASACGATESPTVLNTEKVERAIERSSMAQRGIRVHVSCPSGVHQQEGLTFSCAAVAKDSGTQFVVTQLDGAGHVQYEAR